MTWQARERSTASVTLPTGELALVRPIDPEFWGHDGNIEIERYFAEHDQYLRMQRNSEKVVYHYTTLDALHGIVKDRAIWASDAQHLNDREELSHALERMGALLEAEWDANANRQPLNAIFRPGRAWQFVACLSRARDQLSQWRAYGKRVGVSIAFDREHLDLAAKAQGGDVVDCRYLDHADFASVRPELEPIQESLKKPEALNSAGALVDMALQEQLTKRAVRVATSIKHPSFIEERETRLVFSRKIASDGVQFRSTQQSLTPYLKIDIDGRNFGMFNRRRYANHLGMLEITVWPNNVDNQILDAIDMLLGDVGHVLINRSSSPYRT